MATEAQAIARDWGGGVHPYRVGHRKLGMWLFIMSDSLTFSSLLIGYAYVRASNVWPTPFKFYPSIVFSSVMTLLRCSSVLLKREVASDAEAVCRGAAGVMGFDPEALVAILRRRDDGNWTCTASEYEAYLTAVSRAVEFIDQLQPGDS